MSNLWRDIIDGLLFQLFKKVVITIVITVKVWCFSESYLQVLKSWCGMMSSVDRPCKKIDVYSFVINRHRWFLFLSECCDICLDVLFKYYMQNLNLFSDCRLQQRDCMQIMRVDLAITTVRKKMPPLLKPLADCSFTAVVWPRLLFCL